MALPNFTTINVNQYLINISSNQTEINSLASDIQSNFLNALKSRFTLSTWQQARVTNTDSALLNAIANNFKAASDAWTAHQTYPLEATVHGIQDSTASTATGSYSAAAGFTFKYIYSPFGGTFVVDFEVSCGSAQD